MPVDQEQFRRIFEKLEYADLAAVYGVLRKVIDGRAKSFKRALDPGDLVEYIGGDGHKGLRSGTIFKVTDKTPKYVRCEVSPLSRTTMPVGQRWRLTPQTLREWSAPETPAHPALHP